MRTFMNSAKEVESPCCKYQTHLIIDDLKVHTVKVSTHTHKTCVGLGVWKIHVKVAMSRKNIMEGLWAAMPKCNS